MKIFFYGTIPKKGAVPFGGGEVGNMRTIRMLREAGYDVITIRQRKAGANWCRNRIILTYPFRLLICWFETFGKLLFSSRKNIVHLSGFAGRTIFNEYALMHIMRTLGFRVIYELRGGGAVGFWENGSAKYKRMFRYLLDNACYIFTQGKENIPLIRSISSTPTYHYPNCVDSRFAPLKMPIKPKDKVNLLFYGRMEENKHVDMIVEIAALVRNEFPHSFLTLVGNGRPSYIEYVKSKLKSMLPSNSYTYHAGCTHDELPALLLDKHFYIFPSTQPREGQSNSVTESMAYGIVPIASPQGFNRSTIGNDYLIIEEMEASVYASRIIEIIKKKEIEMFSNFVFNRFHELFTEQVVFANTKAIYYRIINDV